MQLTSERSLPVSPLVAWTALTDVKILKACIPGCASLIGVSDTKFAVTVVAALGPIRATIEGTIELKRYGDDAPPPSYTLHFDGHGRFVGQARGEAEVQLQPQADGGTMLRYGTKARVSGRIARAGAHFIDIAVRELADSFFTSFSDQIRRLEHDAAATRPATDRHD